MNKIHCSELDNLFDWDRRYSINPKEIKWALTTNSWFDPCKNDWNKVYDGDWDKKLEIEKDFVYFSVYNMFKNNLPFKETELYKKSVQQIAEGLCRWGCKNPEEFQRREEHLKNVFVGIETFGFKTQDELEKEGHITYKLNNKNIDDPGVIIDRDGKYLYHNANHRLPMFQILNIPEIKIKVNVRHKLWVDFLQYVRNINKQIWGDENKTYQPINHFDFTDFKTEWSNYRVEIIKQNLFPKSKTLLDIGALWGSFCSALEERGLQCTAIENNESFVYIMEKIKLAQDKTFTILKQNIFDLQNLNYDVVLALNIFHHFLKFKDTFDKLTNFLNKLNAKEMYFQVHNPEESQMKDAYINFKNQEFVDYILSNSRFNQYKEIGKELNRKIYKLWKE